MRILNLGKNNKQEYLNLKQVVNEGKNNKSEKGINFTEKAFFCSHFQLTFQKLLHPILMIIMSAKNSHERQKELAHAIFA